MKIVPLDEDGKYLMKNFLDMVPFYETSRRLYTVLHHQAMMTGNPKFNQTKKVSKKIKRLFLDIYKRICLKLSKRTAQKIFLSPEMEERIAIIIRHYNYLRTKDIFIRLCHRYVGNKEKGQVSESEEMQFYQEVNQKVYQDGNIKKEMVDFQGDEWHDDDQQNQKRVSLFANGQFEHQQDDDQEKDVKKKEKNWDKQIEKQIQKVEAQIVHAKKQRQQQEKIEQEQYQKLTKPSTRSKKKQQQNPKHQQTNASNDEQESESSSSSSSSSSSQENSQSSSKDQNDKSIKEQKDEKKHDPKRQKQQAKKQQVKKQQVKKSKDQIKTQKRKIVKAKGPKDITPVQLKDDKQIWTIPTFRSLCEEFIKQENCLINLASEFSKKHKIYPTISVKQLAQRLVEILIHGFKIYVKIARLQYKKKFQISEIADCDEKYLQKFFRSSKSSPIRKSLIRIYLKNNDDDFELKQKQGYLIFLVMKDGLISLIEKQDENLCDEDQLLELLQTGKLTIGQEDQTLDQKTKTGKQKSKAKTKQSSKRTALGTRDQEEKVTFKAGSGGKKLKR